MSPAQRSHAEGGSILPLILGFFLVAMYLVAGAVAASDAFVQQRNLQALCDGAAAAAAASSARPQRTVGLETGGALQFSDVQQAVDRYLARDPDRRTVLVQPSLSADARTVTLACRRDQPIAFGALFGRGGGQPHRVSSSAREPVRT